MIKKYQNKTHNKKIKKTKTRKNKKGGTNSRGRAQYVNNYNYRNELTRYPGRFNYNNYNNINTNNTNAIHHILPGQAFHTNETAPVITSYGINGEPIIEPRHYGYQYGVKIPTQNTMKVQKNSIGRFVIDPKTGEKNRFARKTIYKPRKSVNNKKSNIARRKPFKQTQKNKEQLHKHHVPIRSSISKLPRAIPVYNSNNNEPEEIELKSLI